MGSTTPLDGSGRMLQAEGEGGGGRRRGREARADLSSAKAVAPSISDEGPDVPLATSVPAARVRDARQALANAI